MLRLGLFGGRFDPIHRAHVAIAQAVADQLQLNEIRWIVTGQPVHKPASTSAEHRLAMTRLALNELDDPRMQIDAREIMSAQQGGSNYTADTVKSLQQEFPDRRLIWILGEDQLQDFHTWSRWQWLIGQVELAICTRPGAQGLAIANTLQESGGILHWVKIAPDAVSSTQIREAIAAGRPVSGLIAPSVARYISENALYQSRVS